MRRRATLVRTFATRTFLLTAVLAVGLGALITYEMLANVRTASMHALSGPVAHSMERVLHDVDLAKPLEGDLLARAHQEARAAVIDHDIVSIRVVNHDKLIVYSTFPEEIGTRVPNGEFSRALAGGTDTSIETSGDDRSAAEVREHGPLLAVYAPVHEEPLEEERGAVVGALEAYQAFAPIQSAMRQSLLRIWGAVLLAVTTGYFVQYRVVSAASLRHQEKEDEVETLNDRLGRSLADLEKHSLGTLRALTYTVDAKDRYTARHSVSVTDYALLIAERLGLGDDEKRVLERGGLLHDLGKVGVPEGVLLKPGPLSREERETMREHSEIGARIVASIPFLAEVVPAVRHHHERWDGGGYPAGLAGEEIPLTARVLAVADAFDAMMSDRPYRPALRFDSACDELRYCAGTQFDPAAVEALMSHPLVGPHRASRRELDDDPAD